MTRDSHDVAQQLATRAELELRAGRDHEATRLYLRAAKEEGKAVQKVPRSKRRTWGILAVSHASLLYKARGYEEAELALHTYLARSDLEPFARNQLRELLDVVLDEQSLPAGFKYSGHDIWLTMRGKEIGRGTAPFELVLRKASELKNVVTRTAELQGNFPFRRAGAPPPEIAQFVQSRTTQAVTGSYRFAVKLTESAQLPLPTVLVDERQRLRAEPVANMLIQVAQLACSDQPDARSALATLVPDVDYRRVMLRLLRNVVPSDKGLSEVEISHFKPEASKAPTRVLMLKVHRAAISAKLQADLPPPGETGEQAQFVGVLRALHLDENWLEVTLSGGENRRCETPSDVLDDVVGPLVNRTVRIRCVVKRRAARNVYSLLDIDSADDS